MSTWDELGTGYPTDELPTPSATAAAFDLLAPVRPTFTTPLRIPVFSDPDHTPTPEEVWELASSITVAVVKLVLAEFPELETHK